MVFRGSNCFDLIVHSAALGVARQTESGCMCVNPFLGLLIAHCPWASFLPSIKPVFCLQCRDDDDFAWGIAKG